MYRRRALAAAVALGLTLTALAAVSPARAAIGALEGTPVGEVPLPEVGGLAPAVPAAECTPDNAYEAQAWPDYGSDCKRLRFAYGPISVKPGQNDALIVPVTIEKPTYDGHIVRFKPDLLYADGTPPRVDRIHLHHAVWLRGEEALDVPPTRFSDDIIPFFASGEEKTIARLPEGYGYPVSATDSWLLLYMVHNYTDELTSVWITYDVDYVAAGTATSSSLTDAHPVWIDVQRRPIAPGAPTTPANPVFNVQKGFGHEEDGRQVCTWPAENCARFDPYGNVTPQQGVPVDVDGAYELVDHELRGADFGTLVWIGGHLHPGGVRSDVELVRDGEAVPIFTSEGVAWNRDDPGEPDELGRAGAPLDSWDFSMTVTGAQYGWKVRTEAGDRFRINATYDAEISWYENMGIVVGFVAPGDDSGLDPFADGVGTQAGVPAGAPRPEGWSPPLCDPGPGVLCTRGTPTHAHLPEAGFFGGQNNVDDLPAALGDEVTEVPVANFEFGQTDHDFIRSVGAIPTVRQGETVRFVNADTAADIWHTVTRCAWPCTGVSGLSFPKADGGDADPANDDDFDSSEVGYGLFLSPAKVHLDEEVEEFAYGWWENPFSPPVAEFADEVDDGVLWEFEADTPGTYAFYCRIHIGMRGAITVLPEEAS